MKIRNIILLLAALIPALGLSAKDRTEAEKIAAAASVLSQPSMVSKAPAGTPLRVLEAAKDYSIVGYEKGAFAVIANNDDYQAVLGYAQEGSDKGNPEFRWWLSNISYALSSGNFRKAAKPDAREYRASVPELLRSRWSQLAPYNNMCPDACLSGCIATAMSQIMYYHKQPVSGHGANSVQYPYGDKNGRTLAVDFSQSVYDWNNILDDYDSVDYTRQQADAVAKLTYDCGVAVNMQYASEASGALAGDAQYALRNNFGFKEARLVYRDNYTDSLWMDLIYQELNENQPILYTGIDPNNGGHAFVCDGYDGKGLVHINWGWGGSENGYYDVYHLMTVAYNFTEQQAMVIGLRPSGVPHGSTVTVDVATPGTLESQLADASLNTITSLKVNGKINSTDLGTLRRMAGRDENGIRTEGTLARLDLSGASIVAGGNPYLVENGNSYTTADDAMPYKAFFHCSKLDSIAFPATLKTFGKAVVGKDDYLETAVLNDGDNYFVKDGAVYSKDTTELIGVLPAGSDTLNVLSGVTTIDEYALSGRAKLYKLVLPNSLSAIGNSAFQHCWNLRELKLNTYAVPATGTNVFDEIVPADLKVYVFGGTKKDYLADNAWSRFKGTDSRTTVTDFDNLIEFGTTIRVRQASREYGDANPRFGYSIEGEHTHGRPVLSCLADAKSPVGTYEITIDRGTLTDKQIRLIGSTLNVLPAPLTVTAVDTIKNVGDENPDFRIVYAGFKNGETDSVFVVKPTVTTTATAQSPAGDYAIVVSGGEAPNYELSYVNGTLRIVSPTGITGVYATPVDNGKVAVYDIQGRLVSTGGTRNLQRGVYIINGKKLVIRQ